MKKILGIVIISIIISIIPIANAQFSIGVEAEQKLIELTVDKSEIIKVKHVISASKMPVTVNLFNGVIVESIEIKNENGEKRQISLTQDDKENQLVTIFPTESNSVIKYDLADKSSLYNNLWTLRTEYTETYSILFPEDVNYIFLNNNIIPLENQKGISVNGGGSVIVQYYSELPKTIQNVEWEENQFDVEIITNIQINKFNFKQISKSISFKINEKDEFVTLSIPQELLGGPYVVLLDDEKIRYSKNYENENNILLTIKPDSVGNIEIIGTTVIPEFSMFIPLIMGFLIVLTVPFMKKFNLH